MRQRHVTAQLFRLLLHLRADVRYFAGDVAGEGTQSKAGEPGSEAGDESGLSVLRGLEIRYADLGLARSTSPASGRGHPMVPHVMACAVTRYSQQESSDESLEARQQPHANTTPPGARPRSYLTIDHCNQSHHAHHGPGVKASFVLTILRMQQAAEKHHASCAASCHVDNSYPPGPR